MYSENAANLRYTASTTGRFFIAPKMFRDPRGIPFTSQSCIRFRFRFAKVILQVQFTQPGIEQSLLNSLSSCDSLKLRDVTNRQKMYCMCFFIKRCFIQFLNS